MKMSRILTLLMAVVILVTMFAGCGVQKNENAGTTAAVQTTSAITEQETVKKDPVTLQFSWWGEKARHDGTLAAVQLWNDKNPDIIIETYYSGWDDYNQKLETQFASKTAPDIFQYSPAKLQEYASQSLLTDLTPNIDVEFSGIDKGLWIKVSVDGKPYGVSAGSSGYGLAFNKTKLTQLGVPLPTDNITWDELFEKFKAVTKDTDGDGKVDFWGISQLMDTSLEMIYPYLRQHGVEMWKSDLKGSNFNDPKVLEALKKWDEVIRQELCVPTGITLAEGMGYLTSGYTAFELVPLSSYPSFQDQTKDELGLVPYPVVAGGPEVREVASGLPIGIYSQSKYKPEAIRFLSWFLTDPEAAKASGMVRGVFPSKAQREATADTLSLPQQQIFRVLNITADYGINKGYPTPKHLGEFTDIWSQEIGKYNFKQVTLEQFLENIIKNADPVLNQD